MREFLEFQGYPIGAVKLLQDNTSSIAMLNKGIHTSARTKHIPIRMFFVADQVGEGHVLPVHCPTENMAGDFFTKGQQGSLFRAHRDVAMGQVSVQQFTKMG
jgi:hypothetical protein